jgi:hypothetical protein
MRDGNGFNLIKLKAHGVDQFPIVSHEAAVELPVSPAPSSTRCSTPRKTALYLLGVLQAERADVYLGERRVAGERHLLARHDLES